MGTYKSRYGGTKNIGGKKFELVYWSESKVEARQRAGAERRRGRLARLVREELSNRPARWLVYSRG